METLKFEEAQQFRQKWMYLIYFMLFAFFCLFLYAGIQQIILGRPFGDKPAPDIVLLGAALFLLLFLALLYQARLETLITDEFVSFRWRPFQKTYTRFNWNAIDKVEITKYGFVGYGWRLTSQGPVHNVNGNMGLRIELKSGKKLILGTQKPEQLGEFLRQTNHGK